MNSQAFNTTLLFYPQGSPRRRLCALWYFTILMLVWNVLGHTVLGFEQSWAAPFVGVGAAVALHLGLEWLRAWTHGNKPRFAGSLGEFLNFLPAALIPGFACSMLLYPNERLWPIVFAVSMALGSKVLLRAPVAGGRSQHVFNPSNLGVALTLVLLPQVGFAPPYHFTENVTGVWDWFIPGIVLVTGIIIHGLFTGRLPLVAAWVVGFAVQGQIRAYLFNTPPLVPLMPMTSAAFIVFTLYMIPDPATTPLERPQQVLFGFSVAAVYGAVQVMHWVFGLFFALLTVCAIRGVALHVLNLLGKFPSAEAREARGVALPSPAGLQVDQTT